MTKQALERGNDIQMEIRELKNALSVLNKDNFFKIEYSRCGINSGADPFLSQLHIELKSVGVDKITKEIDKLEEEFLSL